MSTLEIAALFVIVTLFLAGRVRSAVGPAELVAVAGGGTRVWQWCGLLIGGKKHFTLWLLHRQEKLDRHSGRANNAHSQQLSKLELIAAGR